MAGGRKGGRNSFTLTSYSKTVFALRQVLTLCEAGLVEPDVACSSVNFKGPQVQETAFNSQTLAPAKAIPPPFKGREALATEGGSPRAAGGTGAELGPMSLFNHNHRKST
jgi:hypothetical protein